LNKSNKPVLNKEEISLLGAGFYRLSEKNRENILGKAEGLIFAQQAAQKSMNGIPVKKMEEVL
jgi:hypothetical protein